MQWVTMRQALSGTLVWRKQWWQLLQWELSTYAALNGSSCGFLGLTNYITLLWLNCIDYVITRLVFTVKSPIVGPPRRDHNRNNLSTVTTILAPKCWFSYSANTFLTFERDQPLHKGQKSLSPMWSLFGGFTVVHYFHVRVCLICAIKFS